MEQAAHSLEVADILDRDDLYGGDKELLYKCIQVLGIITAFLVDINQGTWLVGWVVSVPSWNNRPAHFESMRFGLVYVLDFLY